MDHPHIIKQHEIYKYRKQIYLILECCDGGDLYTRSPYSEQQAARMVTNLLSAIQYMHDHRIVHRDVSGAVCFEWSIQRMHALKLIDLVSIWFTAQIRKHYVWKHCWKCQDQSDWFWPKQKVSGTGETDSIKVFAMSVPRSITDTHCSLPFSRWHSRASWRIVWVPFIRKCAVVSLLCVRRALVISCLVSLWGISLQHGASSIAGCVFVTGRPVGCRGDCLHGTCEIVVFMVTLVWVNG